MLPAFSSECQVLMISLNATGYQTWSKPALPSPPASENVQIEGLYPPLLGDKQLHSCFRCPEAVSACLVLDISSSPIDSKCNLRCVRLKSRMLMMNRISHLISLQKSSLDNVDRIRLRRDGENRFLSLVLQTAPNCLPPSPPSKVRFSEI